MGTVVELDIFLKGNFSLTQIFSLLEKKGLPVKIEKLSVFDDWYYANLKNIEPDEFDFYLNDNSLKKFTVSNIILGNKYKLTLLSSVNDELYRNLSFGLNINDLTKFTGSNIDIDIKILYKKISRIIINVLSDKWFKENFVAASMGVEYSVKFNKDIMVMLNDDNGVARWILPKNIGTDIFLKDFIKEEGNDNIIFTRL